MDQVQYKTNKQINKQPYVRSKYFLQFQNL